MFITNFKNYFTLQRHLQRFVFGLNVMDEGGRREAAAKPKLTMSSVTRLGDLFDFGQLFKAFGNN